MSIEILPKTEISVFYKYSLGDAQQHGPIEDAHCQVCGYFQKTAKIMFTWEMSMWHEYTTKQCLNVCYSCIYKKLKDQTYKVWSHFWVGDTK
jgi:hypothetical protein